MLSIPICDILILVVHVNYSTGIDTGKDVTVIGDVFSL